MRKKNLFLLAPILAAVSTLLLSSSASAATIPNSVKYKAAYEGVYQCLSKGAYQEIFKASKGGAGMLKKSLDGDIVKLPYGLTDASDNNANCKEILKGFSDDARSDDNLRAGLLKAGMWSEKDQAVVKNYFAGTSGNGGAGTMGYKAVPVGNVTSEQTTSSLTIALDTERLDAETCRKKSGSTTIVGTQSFYDDQGKTYSQLVFPTITKDNSGNWFLGDVASSSSGIDVPKPGSGGVSSYHFCNEDSYIQITDAGSASSPYYNIYVVFTTYYINEWGYLVGSSQEYGFPSELVTASGSKGWNYSANTRLFKGDITEGKVEETGDFDDYELRYLSSGTLDQAKATMMQTLAKLSATSAAGYNLSLASTSTYDALKLTDEEIYSLYTYYVKDVFKLPVICDGDAAFSSYNDSNSKPINWVAGKTCRIDTAAPATSPAHSVYGVDGDKHFTKKIVIDDVITTLDTLPDDISSKVSNGETGGTIPSTSTGSAGGNSSDDDDDDDGVYPCLEAAESLGWVLCPVLDFLGRAIDKIYSYVEDSFLIVDASMLSGDTYDAWKSFRNFANTIFIIAFLIVILSQVTGFGVSNYGIKKLLPRLIALAILVNISFIICQLAVDVSNIVGANIKTLLSNLSSVHLDGEISAGGIAAQILSVLGLGAAGALAPSVAAIITSSLATGVAGYWLLMILVTFLGFLISILFAGILLAARQAGVILLVVLSPVAIACYALPNTKPIFDKWRRIFMSLLLVYPMCGAIVGGGQFATSLLINNNGGFFYTLVAMLLSVIPFFFIPTLVRTSLNGIGQLGARLSNFGRGMSRGLTGAIRGSERFKDAQRELGLRRDEATVRRLDALRANGKTLTAAQQRRRARAYARADKGRREDLIGRSYNDHELLRYDKEKQEQLLSNLETRDFEDRVTGAKSTYRKDPKMATEDNIIAEHNRLLGEFGKNPNDIRLQSQLRALEEMAMEKGAPGQDKLQQSFARYMTKNKDSWNDNKGQAISKLSAGLATRYGKELNGSDKGFNSMVNHFADGNFKNLESFSGSDDAGYRSSYDAKLAGFSAGGIKNATPGALERGYDALRSNRMDTDDALTLTGNLTQAINDEIISKDIKPAEKSVVQDIVGYGAAAGITDLGQGTIESISHFVNGTDDKEALVQLGANIVGAADNGHTYSEAETRQIGKILNQINAKANTSYTFNPSSVRVNQGGQNGSSSILTGASSDELSRLKLEADQSKRRR